MRLKSWFQSIMEEFLQSTGQCNDEDAEGRNANMKDDAEDGELPEDRLSNKPTLADHG